MCNALCCVGVVRSQEIIALFGYCKLGQKCHDLKRHDLKRHDLGTVCVLVLPLALPTMLLE